MLATAHARAQSEVTINATESAEPDAEISPDLPAGEGESGIEEEPAPPAPTGKNKPAPQPEAPKPFNAVKLQGLNKVTARISTLDAPLGTVMRFGNLEIIARRCWQSPPEDRPENAGLLEIRELQPGEGPEVIFTGWMYSSSPGLSALEHPVYDVTVLECEHLDIIE